MSDLISRETMKDAIDSTTWYHQNRNKDMVGGAHGVEDAWFKAEDVFKAIENAPTAQPNAPTDTPTDLISRRAAIDAPEKFIKDCNPEHFVGHQKFIEFMDDAEIGSFGNWQFANGFNIGLIAAEVAIKNLPSVQPGIKPIEYRDCANAMLRMWMDNVVTDGEYNRIMDKLNAHWWMKNE